MRGADVMQESLFTYMTLNDFVPGNHPLRPIREIVDTALKAMDATFAAMYADSGRDSIPPEQLVRGLLLQALYGLRSERLLCESLAYNMLYRWFVGLGLEKAPWDHSTYTKNRDRLIEHEVVCGLFDAVLDQARARSLLSAEHFSVDGTLVRAWASHKSFQPKEGPASPSAGPRANPEVDFKGQTRTNDTHQSTTDPDARLYKKSPGTAAMPAYLGHVLTENRNGLVVDARLTPAAGTAEREAALEMLADLPGKARKTVGADKAFDTESFVEGCRALNVTPHVAQNTTNRRSRIDARTTRHAGYALSQFARKLIETVFGDAKQHGILRQVKLRGLEKVQLLFTLAVTVVNLRRLPRLLAMAPAG
ncbi:MAG: IS5 family transposase [Comamonadaceae bacterium]|nr:IS5 family transposase [Comamonadaceae bacterium]MCK7497706.1 IS5 family transposase [Comamonadaceae bacterium]MCK7498072.1 IS5 family transposase [Comamonadaceae bacterium]MCK7577567.1 IS5 family transposase [Chromatiales bacterium]MCK7583483.1 IS5 family transposase [Chromatiales bacterium]